MIINNANVVTFWPTQPLVQGALLAIEGKSIVDFGKIGKLVDRYDDPNVLDAGGRLLLPGMIDAHRWLTRSLACGLPTSGMRPKSSRELREQLWWRLEDALDESSIYWAALSGLMDAMASGVTTSFVLQSSPAHVEGSLEIGARAFSEVGTRGSLAYAVSARSSTAVSIRENVRHLERFPGGRGQLLTALFGMEASAALEESALTEAVRAADGLGARFHLVLGEDGEDWEACRARFGMTPAVRLGRAGVWKRGGIAVHPMALSREDEAALVDAPVWLTHCPQAALVQGEGPIDLMRLGSSGAKFALGTAGVGGVAEEFRVGALQQRARGHALADAVRVTYRAAFGGNADLATEMLGPQLGRIKPGARADLVILDYVPSTPLSEENLPEHLFWRGATAPIHSVIVNGRLLYHNREFLDLDEERIRARTLEVARATWESI